MPTAAFVDLLTEQIGHEFAAHYQYVAIAAHYDGQTLPRLATYFYAQAVEERNHAMMMVRYLLDNDVQPAFPAQPAPQGRFADVVEPIALALAQERRVTDQIVALARTRAAGRGLPGRAVPAVVPQGADRGGRRHVRPARRRAARRREPPRCGSRSTWCARRGRDRRPDRAAGRGRRPSEPTTGGERGRRPVACYSVE
jgi:rubrerythrin